MKWLGRLIIVFLIFLESVAHAGICDSIFSRISSKKDVSEQSYTTKLQRRYSLKSSKQLLKTWRKAQRLTLENSRFKTFNRNEQLAHSILQAQGVRVYSVPNTDSGSARGIGVFPSDDSVLNLQASQIKDLTGYELIYSPLFPWVERAKHWFGVAAPEAGVLRPDKRIYVTPHMIILGRLSHFEKHEVDHAILNHLEDEGEFTGPLWLTYAVNEKTSTGIEAYPNGLTFQEIYAFADQLFEIALELQRMEPGVKVTEELLDVAGQLLDVYINILTVVHKRSESVLGDFAALSETATIEKSEKVHGRESLVVRFGKYSQFIFPVDHLSWNEEKKKKLGLYELQKQLKLISKTSKASRDIIFSQFYDGAPVVTNPENGQWAPSFIEALTLTKKMWMEILPEDVQKKLSQWDSTFMGL